MGADERERIQVNRVEWEVRAIDAIMSFTRKPHT